MKQYYYQEGGKSYGPFTKKEMMSKNLPHGTYIWFPGLDSWIPIDRVAELNNAKQNKTSRKEQ